MSIWQLSGPAFYEALSAPSRDLNPESLRGSYHYDLTLGIARGALQTPGGFHRFEPVTGRDHSRPGQFHLPDKEFRLILLLHGAEEPCVGAGHFCRPLHVAMQSGLSLRSDLGRSDRLALSL